MSLIRWQPMQELETLRRQMDRLFHDLSIDRNLLPLAMNNESIWAPAIELRETDTEITLKAEIPGVKAEDLEVQVTPEAVSITGETKQESHQEESKIRRSELFYGRFERMISLPAAIKHEEVKSAFNNGILTLTMPKAEAAQPKVIKLDLTKQ